MSKNEESSTSEVKVFWRLMVRSDFSDNEWPLKVHCGFRAVMFHFAFPIFAQKVEADGILFWIHFFEQPCPQLNEFRRLNPALENRKLHSLPVIEASFSYPSQASCTRGR